MRDYAWKLDAVPRGRLELNQYCIRVKVIEPGWIDTLGGHEYYTEEEIQRTAATLALECHRHIGGDRQSSAIPGIRRRFLYYGQHLESGFVLPR